MYEIEFVIKKTIEAESINEAYEAAACLAEKYQDKNITYTIRDVEKAPKVCNFEAVLIVRPDVSQAETMKDIENKFNCCGCKVSNVDQWGQKRMAFVVNGYSDGVYYLVSYQATLKQSNMMSKMLEVDDNVLRKMIIRKGD